MSGHLRSASGACGLLQCLYTINTGFFPGLINFRSRSNEADLPFTIPRTPLKRDNPDQQIHTAVSSFGFGGTNYHMTIELHCWDYGPHCCGCTYSTDMSDELRWVPEAA